MSYPGPAGLQVFQYPGRLYSVMDLAREAFRMDYITEVKAWRRTAPLDPRNPDYKIPYPGPRKWEHLQREIQEEYLRLAREALEAQRP